MLTALVIEVKAGQPGTLDGATGRAIQGLWLNHWKRLDPQVSHLLHAPSHTKPYTVSPLMGLPLPVRGRVAVSAGDRAWFRVAALNSLLSERLTEEWQPLLAERVSISGIEWQILNTTCDNNKHPWAGQIDILNFVQLLGSPDESEGWRLEFFTPTTFKVGSDDLNLPFPSPRLLVQSWRRRWNELGGNPFEEEMDEEVENSLAVSRYDLETVPVRSRGRIEIGCVGEMWLDPKKLRTQTRRKVDILSRFAFWAGSGQHTTQGFGLTRLKE